MDEKKIQEQLIHIYETASKQELTTKEKKDVGVLYSEIRDASIIFKQEMAQAINSLVDIAYDTGRKLTKKDCEQIVNKLKQNNR